MHLSGRVRLAREVQGTAERSLPQSPAPFHTLPTPIHPLLLVIAVPAAHRRARGPLLGHSRAYLAEPCGAAADLRRYLGIGCGQVSPSPLLMAFALELHFSFGVSCPQPAAVKQFADNPDDARLHDAPVYVHCKAGKSRSVTVVLAYLIHANAWTLKTSYAYVAERRHGISPNIGFVAELIQFEETELGNKGKGGESESQSQLGHGGEEVPEASPHPKPGLRYTRESLPPEWGRDGPSSSQPLGPIVAEPEHTPEGTSNRRQKQSAADIEVRKNGQWVHGRR